jgi:hypothetical protein
MYYLDEKSLDELAVSFGTSKLKPPNFSRTKIIFVNAMRSPANAVSSTHS